MTDMDINTLLKSIAIFFVLTVGVTISATAQNKVHKVKKGETLYSIAQQYNVEVTQLKKWNNVDADGLSVGQSLVIRPSTASGDSIIHEVEKQETLFSISKKYNVSIAEIKTWNSLESNNLSIGQKLTIYPAEKKSGQQSIVVDKKTEENTYYTVKSGDSLYRIAQLHNMSVEELKQLNSLSSNTIRVGQKLTVRSRGGEAPPSVETSVTSSPQGKFVSYEISGAPESLQQILDKFKMTEKEFRALNKGVEESTFQSGREVTVLAPPSRTYNNPYLKSANMQSLGSVSVSKYSDSAKATTTTNGELYNPEALTAAHSNISLGSVIYIENPQNSKGLYVRINDRSSGNKLKLSAAAWQVLDFKTNSPTVTIYQN